MICDKKTLREYIAADNNWLIPKGVKQQAISRFAAYQALPLKRYLKYLRYQEYYINTACGNKLKGFCALYFERKKNRLGTRLGIEIGPNCFGKGLNLYHGGNIVINPDVRAGENCSLHGSNCIGNNGKTPHVPTLGNNVDIGFGAVIIGDVNVADNIKIGANAVVNRSFTEAGCTVAGVPARVVKSSEVKCDDRA